MLEWWNIGKTAIGRPQYWVNGKLGLDLKARMDKILHKPTVRSIHFCIIPGMRQIRIPQKIPFLLNQL
jgi:hypothetical protein